MSEFTKQIDLMRSTGDFSEQEIQKTVNERREIMVEAGFDNKQIGEEVGQPIFNDKKVADMFNKQFEDNGVPKGNLDINDLTPVTDLDDSFIAGFGFSASSVLAKAPETIVDPNAPAASRIASGVGTLAGDFPFMVAGAAAGGAIGAAAGGVGAIPGAVIGAGLAFALPELFRSVMMESYQNGEVNSFGEFMERSSAVFIDTSKAFAIGAATGGVGAKVGQIVGKTVGKFGPVQPKIASPIVRDGVKTAAEINTMVAVGSALEGHVPEPREFMDAGIIVGGLKAAVALATKGRSLYVKTGVRPRDMVEDATKDVTIHQDMVSRNKPIPEVYAKNSGIKEPEIFNFEEKSPKQMVDRLAQEMQIVELKAGEQGRVEESAQVIRDTLEARGLPKAEAAEQVTNMLTAAKEKNSLRLIADAARTGLPPESKAAPASIEAARAEMLEHIEIGGEAKKHITAEDVQTAVFNELNPIKQSTLKTLEGKLKQDGLDAYKLSRLTRGIFAKAAFALERATFNFRTLKNNGKSLKEILEPLRTGAKKKKPGDRKLKEISKDIAALDEFRAFAAAKDALDSKARGVDTGFPIEAARRIVIEDAGKYGKIQKELVEYQNRVTAQLRDSGILSEESYKIITDLNQNHVPLFKFMDSVANGLLGDVPLVKSPIKVRGGGAAAVKVIDPIESIIKNTFTSTALADRNLALQTFVLDSLAAKNAKDIIREVEPTVRGTTVTESELGAFLKRHGQDKIPDDLLTVFRASREPLGKNEIAVFFEGKRRVFEVNPEIAKAFKSLDGEVASLAVKFFAIPAKTLRAGIVISPDFIGRNFFRDQPAAFALSKSGYMPGVSFVHGMMSIIKQDKTFENFLKSGGANATIVAMDRQYIKQEIFKLTGPTGLHRKAWNVVTSPLQMLGLLSELAENSTRLGEFRLATAKEAKAEAARKGEVFDPTAFPSKQAIQKGGFEAREVTVDFMRKGAQMKAVSLLSAFFNPHLQGLERTVRGLRDDPVGVSMKLGVSITLPTVLLWMHNRDDPRYINLPQWQKDFFWIIPTDYGIMRIPKSHELGMVFGTLPERLLDGFYRDNPNAFKDFDKTVAGALIPNAIPTFAQPVMEQFANTSLFTGAPIVPSRLEKQMPEYQYKEYTTETAKALGKMFGAFPGLTKEAISEQDLFTGGVARALSTPLLIENYIRAWSGTMGQYALQLMDASLRKSGVLPDPVRPTSTLADIPFVKAFFVRYPSAGLQPIADFYESYSERVVTNTTLRERIKEGDIEGMERVLEFDDQAFVKLEATKKTLGLHSRMIRMINKDPSMNSDDKRQLIDSIYYGMVQAAADGNAQIVEMQETQKRLTEEQGQ